MQTLKSKYHIYMLDGGGERNHQLTRDSGFRCSVSDSKAGPHLLASSKPQEGWEPPPKPGIEQYVLTQNPDSKNVCRLSQQMNPTL